MNWLIELERQLEEINHDIEIVSQMRSYIGVLYLWVLLDMRNRTEDILENLLFRKNG